MRTLGLAVLLLACVVLGLATAVQAAPIVTAGLVGYWNFDGNANDTSGVVGGPHNGTWYGTAVYSTDVPNAMGGQSADMRAANTSVYVSTDSGANSFFNLDSLSIAFWTKARHPASDWGWWVCKDGDNGTGYRVVQPGGPWTKKMSFGMRGPGDGPSGLAIGPIDDTAWWHYVITRGDGKARIYQNGIMIGETNSSGAIIDGVSPLSFGAYFGHHWDGTKEVPDSAPVAFAQIRMDEIYVFNRAITLDEVLTLYQSPEPATMALLAFGGLGLMLKRSRR